MSDQPRLKRARNEPRTRYRSCVICGKLMHRRLYGRGSGVVIDTCRDHGIWFDHGELFDILKSGGDKNNRVMNLLNEMFKDNT